MSRGLDSSQLAAAAAPQRIAIPLIEMFFDSGTLRMALCQFDIIYGPDTYTAIGPFSTLDALTESSVSTEGLRLKLNGIDPAVIAIATSEPYRGRIARLLKAYLDPDTNTVISVPRVQFPGRIHTMLIDEQNDKCDVTVTIEHYDAELARPTPLRLNDSDQQRLYPGDRGCEYVETMVEKQIVWPSKEVFKQ